MKDELFTDFETFSTVDLKKKGLWNYANHPDTGVLCLSYAFDDDPAGIIYFDDDMCPDDMYALKAMFEHVKGKQTFVAHNASFELAIWNLLFKPRYKWPELNPSQVICTMAECYAMNLPGSLENAAAALGLRMSKDTDGRALMLRMCKPLNNGKLISGKEKVPKWYHKSDSFTFMGKKISGPEAVKRLGQYCIVDTEVEREIHRRAVPLSAYERKMWTMDYHINRRGVLFDKEAVEGALLIRDDTTEQLNKEMNEVTDGFVAKCSSVGALKDWAADFGVIQDSLSKDVLVELIENDDIKLNKFDLPPEVRKAFELRREAGRATSVSKLATISAQSDPQGRVHNMFQYHGAGTGRWAGRGVQPHNFTRDLPPPEVVEEILSFVKQGDASTIDILYGPPLTQISKLLRGFITAGGDRTFIGGDYSNVEGRGLAWLAGEEWKLNAFREYDAGIGPDLYKLTYANTFNVDVGTVTDTQRQVGKVEELALGYAGGVGAFRQMGGDSLDLTDEEIDDIKNGWREVHPKIKAYWKELQQAAMNATIYKGKTYTAGEPGRQVKFKTAGSFLWCLLPSGRALCYPYPQIRHGNFGPYLTYKIAPSQDDFKKGRIIEDKTNTRTWARVSTYGGKLSENITQAICRDLIGYAMLNLDDAGYKIVLHVHDESVEEGNFTEDDRIKVETIMNTVPGWAKDFPLKADCWMNKRYIK